MKRIGFIKGERIDQLPTASIADDAVTKAKLDSAIKYWKLERNAQIFQGTALVFQAFTDVDVATVVAAYGITIPPGAKGIIMLVRITDAAATPFIIVRRDGEGGFYYQQVVQQQVNGIETHLIVIVELSAAGIIEWYFEGGSGAGTAHARLWGWVIEP